MTIIAGPFTAQFPITPPVPVVEIRPTWSDAWQIDPTLELLDAGVCAASEGIDEARFRRDYGSVAEPWQSGHASRLPLAIVGWWVRVRLIGLQGDQVIFVGKIGTATRTIHGGQVLDQVTGLPIASGEQTWVAYGPLRILDKLAISQSVQIVDGTETTLDRLQDMNGGQANATIGNRSAAKGSSGTYCFGGEETWTNGQFAAYLVKHFVDESAGGGPAWSIGGQADALEEIEVSLPLKAGKTTAATILRCLIARERGLDWMIRPTPAGFQIEVFALLSQSFTFGGKTLPKNPNAITFHADDHLAVLDCVVERSDDHAYGRVRAIGRPILVCCTLRGELVHPFYEGSLTSRWDAALEDAYLAGTGAPADSAAAHDQARADERFGDVFQRFGAPDDWDHQAGAAAPQFDASGSLVTAAGESAIAPFQNQVRTTEAFLPLATSVDYTVDPVVDYNGDVLADLMKPCVWIESRTELDESGPAPVTVSMYMPAEFLGISVSVPSDDWGVVLSSSPRHVLAREDWSGAAATLRRPQYEWREMVATIAFRADNRLELSAELSDAVQSDGVLDVSVPDCELWYVAPHTVVATQVTGELVTSGDKPRIVRDDTERLAAVLAGVIARYQASRTKATITIRGHWPYQGLVGRLLEGIESGGDVEKIYAPVTSVRWSQGDTVIGCGYVDDLFEAAFQDKTQEPALATADDYADDYAEGSEE